MSLRHTVTEPTPPTTYQQAASFFSKGRLSEAGQILRDLLARNPADAAALTLYGRLLRRAEKQPQAAVFLEQALAKRFEDVALQVEYAHVKREMGELAEARSGFRRALLMQPDSADAHRGLADVYAEMGERENALVHYGRSLGCGPHDPPALMRLVRTLKRHVGAEELLPLLEQVLAKDPENPGALTELSLVHRKRFDFPVARELGQRAVAAKPDDIPALVNMGITEVNAGHLDDALAWYARVEALAAPGSEAYADARFMDGWARLMKGDLAGGWLGYAYRPGMRNRLDAAILTTPLPGDLTGKRVLLMNDQGIGDEIFFLRYLTELKARGAWVGYCPSHKVGGLVSRIADIDQVFHANADVGTVDFTLSVGDLPLALGSVRHLHSLRFPVLPSTQEEMRGRLAALGPGPAIGVTWRAGITSGERRFRKGPYLHKNTPLDAIAESLRDLPAQVLVLQRKPEPGEIDRFSAALGWEAHDFTALNDDLERMAALLSLLDDYVTVSNTNVHLRAAVCDRPCKVLVPTPPEWRWGLAGDSPWFPGYEVFRQDWNGDWSEAFAALKRSLHSERSMNMEGGPK